MNEGKISRPNVLFISVDDRNDWVEGLDGHPQAKTPHMASLARTGILFKNAHCQAPVCNPSRASLMTSLLPSSTGIYFLKPPIRKAPDAMKNITIPKRFSREGYKVMGVGKLFHSMESGNYFDEYGGRMWGFGPRRKTKISYPHGVRLWDWGAYPEKNEEMPDYQIADWAINKLKQKYDRPFFLGVGFHRPHVPMYVPQEWFDLHPRKDIILPKIEKDDLKDLSRYAINITRLEHIGPPHKWVREHAQWKHAVQAYLASSSFVDAQVGRVIDALKKSPHNDNTVIVLFSDHGFHLGEKDRWAKRTLWEDGTRVPLIFAGPGVPAGKSSTKPVGLVDIYPTLLDLTGLKKDKRHDGHSLRPLIDDPQANWPHRALTSFGPGNHAVRSERWRYIHYYDGSEELYDHQIDPHEWNNLAGDKKYEKVLADHRKFLPKKDHKLLDGVSTGHKSYAASMKKK